jgi:hypothetical protein
MALQEEREKQLEDLLNRLRTFARIDKTSLLRLELGEELSFQICEKPLSKMQTLYTSLLELQFDQFSTNSIGELNNASRGAHDVFKSILGFTVRDHDSPFSMRDQIVRKIHEVHERCLEVVPPLIASALAVSENKTASREIKALTEEAKKGLEAIRVAQKQAIDLVPKIREIAESAGVSEHARYFKAEADHHSKYATRWLVASTILALIAILVGLWIVITYGPTDSNIKEFTEVMAYFAISKLLIVSAILSGAYWAAKTYKSHRHNAVVNRHRQNALLTFQVFAQSASDDQTKNAILLEATRCIFGPQATGYIPSDSDSAPHSQILEIVRTSTAK